MVEKNLRGKSIKIDWSGKTHRANAYEHWATRDGSWHWYVLKHYQASTAEAANPYARVFCDVVSPIVGDSGELGDTYLHEIKSSAILVSSREV